MADLRQLRKERGLTQEATVPVLKVCLKTIKNWEKLGVPVTKQDYVLKMMSKIRRKPVRWLGLFCHFHLALMRYMAVALVKKDLKARNIISFFQSGLVIWRIKEYNKKKKNWLIIIGSIQFSKLTSQIWKKKKWSTKSHKPIRLNVLLYLA